MDNILTPEEENKVVTYGELLKIFMPMIEELGKNAADYSDTLQDQTFKIVRKLTDSLVETRDCADYKRQRDMRFILGLISQLHFLDKDELHREYVRWCDEFDKLNKPQNDSEDTNG